MIQCLGNVGVDLREKIGRQFSWSPQSEPYRCVEAGNCLGNGREVRQRRHPLFRGGGDKADLSGLGVLLNTGKVDDHH